MTSLAPPRIRHLYDDALATLIAWRPADNDQDALKRDFLATLASDPSAVAKSGPPAHLTASCIVLSPDRASVLLHLHRKAGAWLQFGGHVEEDDDGLLAAATREAREESGLGTLEPLPDPVDLDRHLLGASFGSCREHLDVRYVAFSRPGSATATSAESHDVAWFATNALPSGVPADVVRLIERARAVG